MINSDMGCRERIHVSQFRDGTPPVARIETFARGTYFAIKRTDSTSNGCSSSLSIVVKIALKLQICDTCNNVKLNSLPLL